MPSPRSFSLLACALATLLVAAPVFATPAPERDPAAAARAARHMVALAATPLVTPQYDAVDRAPRAGNATPATTRTGTPGHLQVAEISKLVLLFATGVVLLGFARDRGGQRG